MGNLFGIADAPLETWKKLRKAANPPFSLPKIKKYMEKFTKACKEMVEYVEGEAQEGKVVQCKEFISRVAINTLGAVGFGMDVNTFKDKESELKKQAEALSEMWRWMMVIMMPSIAALFRVNVYNPKAEAWFVSTMKRYIKEKKSNDTIGKDILSTIIKIHEENPQELDERGLQKTIMQYIFDGFNSISDNMHGVLALIATHPEIQSKLQEEIDAVFDAKEDGDVDITDTDVIGMNYLDSLILEANRLLCVGVTGRNVTIPWKIPDTDITLPVGTAVIIPISALHRDDEFWENPTEFRPERFNAANKDKIKTGTYIPFGAGPRQCMGSIYAKFETKMVLIYLLRFFNIDNCENLPKQFEFDPMSMSSPKGGLKVKFHKRNI